MFKFFKNKDGIVVVNVIIAILAIALVASLTISLASIFGGSSDPTADSGSVSENRSSEEDNSSEDENIANYLTFTGDEDFTTIALSNVEAVGVNVLISDDAETWQEWDGSDYKVTDSTVYVCGYDNTAFVNPSIGLCNFSGNFSVCSGNVMSLLDYENPDNAVMGDYCFYGLFEFCSSLVTAPELPATTLSELCYCYMFWYCTSLVAAPELPATTLSVGCYSHMFLRCTSLVTAPELPAIDLTSGCYVSMFYECYSLVIAPELPATSLAEDCYQYMFAYCTSLVTAPKLPAMELTGYCYDNMFCNCTSLVTAPELPATELAVYCYRDMFYYCTSLVTAPALPATELAGCCYQSMFSYCTSLTTIPSLSHVTVFRAYSCYRMFCGCSLVTVSTESSYGDLLITTGDTADYFTDMFTSTGGTFTGSPAASTSYYTSNVVIYADGTRSDD